MTYSQPASSTDLLIKRPRTRAGLPDDAALARHGLKLDLYFDFTDAEAEWRAFERHASGSCYQHFDFLSAWQRHIGQAQGVRPLIVVARQRDGQTAFIWPLGLARKGPAVVAGWLGGKHSNFNTGLYDSSFARGLGPDALHAVLAHIKQQVPELDLFELSNQPESWMGTPNPLARLPAQQAPSPAYSTALPADFQELLLARRSAKSRKRARWQMNKLGEFGELRFYRAACRDEADRILAAFFAQRRVRMQEAGIRNPFEDAGVQAMFRELAEKTRAGADAPLELFALEAGGRILATCGGGRANGRFSISFNSFDMEEQFSRYSPGELLLQLLIERCIAEGLRAFDLGIGRASYKDAWCDTEEQLFDTLVAVSLLGATCRLARSLWLAAKRLIKNNPRAWSAAQQLRKLLGGISR